MNRFELLRYERGLTQQEVATGAGVSRSTIVRLEQLAQPKPAPMIATRLATFYKITVAELLGLDEREMA